MDKAQDWQKLVIAMKQFFGHEAGKTVLDYLSYQCFENRNTFVDNNEAKSNRNLGRREIILIIRDWMSKNPQDIPENLKEKTDA